MASEAGNQAARAFGMPEAPVPVQQSVDFIMAEVRCLLRPFQTTYHL